MTTFSSHTSDEPVSCSSSSRQSLPSPGGSKASHLPPAARSSREPITLACGSAAGCVQRHLHFLPYRPLVGIVTAFAPERVVHPYRFGRAGAVAGRLAAAAEAGADVVPAALFDATDGDRECRAGRHQHVGVQDAVL